MRKFENLSLGEKIDLVVGYILISMDQETQDLEIGVIYIPNDESDGYCIGALHDPTPRLLKVVG